MRTAYECRECGAGAPAWEGRCRSCGEWGSLVERAPVASVESPVASDCARPTPLSDVAMQVDARVSTGIGELDRVLGGGWVPGSAVLIGGDPGVGKSTLLLSLAAGAADASQSSIYVSAEETPAQVKLRAERLGVGGSRLLILAENRLEAVLRRIEEASPSLAVIDSIQMMHRMSIPGAPGSVSQVRECGSEVVQFAKRTGIAVFLIGHVTKEGSLAGPRVLEHMVDTVLYFEGDRSHRYRILRATKNRFGAIQEIGVFSMQEDGLREVVNPSGYLYRSTADPTPGSIAFPVLEGSRTLLVEIQALASPSVQSVPMRRVSGVDGNRLPLLQAVLERRSDAALGRNDIFVNAVGGIQAIEPAADLSICLSIVSSLRDRALPAGTAAAGEIGLGGEVRGISRPGLRAQEVRRMGLRRLLVPSASVERIHVDGSLEVAPVSHLEEAIRIAFGNERSTGG